MGRAADPEFTRLVHLIRDLQIDEAVQVRIERPKEGNEISLITFPSSKNPQAMNERQEVRKILGLNPSAEQFKVYYGGYSGKDDEIVMMTRSTLQVMAELAADVQVPPADVAVGKAAPGR